MEPGLPRSRHDARRRRSPRSPRDNLRDECRELPPPLGDPATITRWSATNLRDNQVQRGNVAPRQSNLRVALASVNQSRHHLKTATISSHPDRSEEHQSELQSLTRIYYAVFCL